MSTETFVELYPIAMTEKEFREVGRRFSADLLEEFQAKATVHNTALRETAEELVAYWEETDNDTQARNLAVDELMTYFTKHFLTGSHEMQNVGGSLVGIAVCSEEVFWALRGPDDFGPNTRMGHYCAAVLMNQLLALPAAG